MHQPRPHGLSSVGADLTDEDAAAVELTARRLTNLKDLSGMPSLRTVRALPDGGYVIAQDMGGVFRAITHKPIAKPREDLPEGVATPYIPMLFSGVVPRGIVGEGKGVEVRFTKETVSRLSGYQKGGQAKAPSAKTLQRFRIPLNPKHKEFEPLDAPPTITYTQYDKLRPTWFSGCMASIVQIVSGYGKQQLDELPDDPVEQARVVLPKKIQTKIVMEIGNTRLPGYTGLPDPSGEIQYDYKFNSTDGVAFSPKGKPWLVRISNAGVYVMPMPIIPATRTNAFREWVEENGDTELLEIIDRFGGMPSGEAIPDSVSAMQSWVRAGVIQKLADTREFYQHDFFSSTSGWSFSESGNEAANTCVEYKDNGEVHCHAFMLSINVPDIDGDGMLPESWRTGSEHSNLIISEYLASIYRMLTGNRDRERAIKYKLRRFSGAEILSRAFQSGTPQHEVDYWDGLSVGPQDRGSAALRRISTGQIPHYGIAEFKFPEPFLGGCVSLNATPNGKPDKPLPKCDTIIYMYHEGDNLKTIKFFNDDREYQAEIESDFEECMIVGEWTETTTETSSKIMGTLYTSEFDERKPAANKLKVVNVKGVDLGYTYHPRFHPNAGTIYYKTLDVKRRRYFARTTNTKQISGYGISVFCCVPFFNRCATVYGVTESFDRATESETARRIPVSDPNEYKAWVTGGYPYQASENGADAWMNHPPTPKGVHLLIVEKHNYVTNTEASASCREWADNGKWLGVPGDLTSIWSTGGMWSELDDDDALHHIMILTPPRPAFRNYSITLPAVQNKTEYKTSMDILGSPVKIGEKEINYMYYQRLPDENMNTLWVDGIKNCMGLVRYASISAVGDRKVIGKSVMADNKTSHHFIGVINE